MVGAAVDSVTFRTAVDVFPAVSVAVTVIGLAPATSGTAALQTLVPVAVPLAGTAGFDQLMLARATLSLAVPPIERGLAFVKAVPEDVGLVIAIVGATESWTTVIEVEVLFPAWSDAVTVIVLSPATSAIGATLHEVVPVTTPTAPLVVLTQVTLWTATLSEAVPERAIDVAGVTMEGKGVGPVILTVGGTVSSVTVRTEGADMFPAMSVEVTVMTLGPLVSGMLAVQEVVPVAVPVPPVPALDQDTEATDRLSAALPPRRIGAMLVKNVAPAVGAVIDTVGRVESSVTAITAVLERPAVFRAVTVMVFKPATRETEAFQEVVPTADPEGPVELAQVTEATPRVSEDVPLRRIVGVFVIQEPDEVGPVIAMPGAVVFWMTVRMAVELLPEASKAVMVITWDPETRLIVGTDHEVPPVRVATPVAGTTVPDVAQWTDVTPTLSEVAPESATVPFLVTKVGDAVGKEIETVGGVTSKVTEIVVVETFPATSVAVTVMGFTPTSRGTFESQLGAA